MLEPLQVPLSTPITVSFVLNSSPFYDTVEFSDPASVTVNAILHYACDYMKVTASELRLRWITDKVSVSALLMEC